MYCDLQFSSLSVLFLFTNSLPGTVGRGMELATRRVVLIVCLPSMGSPVGFWVSFAFLTPSHISY